MDDETEGKAQNKPIHPSTHPSIPRGDRTVGILYKTCQPSCASLQISNGVGVISQQR